MKKSSIFNLALAFVALMAFWLAMSGKFDLQYIGFGVLSVLVVLAVNHGLRRHQFYPDEIADWNRLRLGFAAYYLVWLTWQIIISGIQVASIIVRRSLPISTYVVKFKTNLASANERMILGNSITLTPGTLTLDITEDEFTVHALTFESLSSLLDDSMPSRVARLFSRGKKAVIHDIRFIASPDELP